MSLSSYHIIAWVSFLF